MSERVEPGSAHLAQAVELMTRFAERTGLSSERAPQRYLWTDAFAVCNFLAIAQATGDERQSGLALRLVERVHDTLGRHRPDDVRRGWISGLSEAEGAAHPTRGGLRIGKPLPERPASDPFDDELEWERDGQYFHYLTRWMHALDQVARWTREPRFNLWARELADVAHAAFRYLPVGGGHPRLVWKMSIDLTRPLVPSMGQHDPLDGLITCAQLQTTAALLAARAEGPGLQQALAGFAALLGTDFTTPDPLGIGGLLTDAGRVAQLLGRGTPVDGDLLGALLGAAAAGLGLYARRGDLRAPARSRLAFRELGLSLGLHAVERIERELERDPGRFSRWRPLLRARLDTLAPFLALGPAIESFWLQPAHREGESWSAHRDINEVMLATSLLPDGYLVLRSR